MFDESYKSEDVFLDRCPCAIQVLNFVDSIKDTDARWYFYKGYAFHSERRFSIIFKSYAMPEYEDYVLSVEAQYSEGKCNFRIVKKVDNLLTDNE